MYILLKPGPVLTLHPSLRTVKAPVLESAVPIMVTTKAAGLTVNMVPSDTEEDNSEDEASTASTAPPGQETSAVTKTPSPVNSDSPADSASVVSPVKLTSANERPEAGGLF